MIARRGRQCGVDAYPHRFRHHFSHTWLDRGGPEGDLMELNGWAFPADAHPLRRQRPQRPRPPQLRPHHGRQHLTLAITASRSTRAGTAVRRVSESCAGNAEKARPAWTRASRHVRHHPAAHLPRHGRTMPGGSPRTRRCRIPGAGPRPRPWPSRRVKYHTVLNPRLQRRLRAAGNWVGRGGNRMQIAQFWL
jgi:hypothetical protein